MSTPAAPTAKLAISLDGELSKPLYRQLYERLRAAILAGQLQPGARLPSTRGLASELGISRSTTVLAYEQLLLEGYLESRIGRGTQVSDQVKVTAVSEAAESPRRKRAGSQKSPSTRIASRALWLETVPRADHLEVVGGGGFPGDQPALDLFPFDVWARLVARRARQSLSQYAHYQPLAGYDSLREAIAAHIGISRGVRCTPDQIIVSAGAQGALDLAARTLLDQGEAAWVENPGYFGSLGALTIAGARIAPVPVDEHGLDVQAGRRLCPDARLVATTPSHQFPTGVTMSLARRMELLDWARKQGAWILEDDYDSEYRFSGRPLDALQGLDQAGRVLYVGSFSKVLFPTLRLGYLVAPLELVEALLATRSYTGFHLPILEQLALADFMQEGHYARHLRRMRQHYRRRRDCLDSELRAHLAGLLDVYVPDVGIHLVGWLPPGKDDRRAAELAAAAGIRVVPISKYSLEPLPRGGLHFGFAGTDEEGIRRGVETLAEALQQL